mmetsp:Transcript_8413/g.22766  ORF Transcript_8413/g.22766 Transcript_8413/m.22766 type:complete len:240 (+) Transcript_8413:598-1317(+)
MVAGSPPSRNKQRQSAAHSKAMAKMIMTRMLVGEVAAQTTMEMMPTAMEIPSRKVKWLQMKRKRKKKKIIASREPQPTSRRKWYLAGFRRYRRIRGRWVACCSSASPAGHRSWRMMMRPRSTGSSHLIPISTRRIHLSTAYSATSTRHRYHPLRRNSSYVYCTKSRPTGLACRRSHVTPSLSRWTSMTCIDRSRLCWMLVKLRPCPMRNGQGVNSAPSGRRSRRRTILEQRRSSGRSIR